MNKLRKFFNNHKAKEGKQKNHGKNYTALIQKTSAKVFAFIMVIFMTAITLASVFGAVLIANNGVYTTPETERLKIEYKNLARTDTEEILSYLYTGGKKMAQDYCSNRNISLIRLTNKKNNEVIWQWTSEKTSENTLNIEFNYYLCKDTWKSWDLDHSPKSRDIVVYVSIFDKPIIKDNYMMINQVVSFAYGMRYWIYIIGFVSLIAGILSFVFLLCASGHRKGSDEIHPGWGTKIPLDLLTAIAAVFIFYNIINFWVKASTRYNEEMYLLGSIISGLVIESVFIGWSMSLALRIKLGEWWKNTVIYRVLVLVLKILKWIVNFILRLCKNIAKLFVNLPLIRKTVLTVTILTLFEFIAMLYCWYAMGIWICIWFIEKIILIPALFYTVIVLRKLQKGGTALAQGDLSYQVDTSKMIGNFKRHGESLNSIAEGMTKAVDQRLKSERFKTELITNVSHDIKTPLTSIINYADLISKEPCDNNKITEYSGVLLRQSERLKRLIDDLVEASKASTGNLEVLLAPCEANILLTQTAGEYEQKMQSKNLELVTAQSEKPVMIMADGRRLWRVFDNLMNNIFKYAQSGTRVYLSLEEQGDQAVITFKNTSRAPLNLSADELMERFVRGDKSRNTEGNGLGLSIAKSLTELQKGSLDLAIDGDLFKVILRFPIIK